MGYRSLKYAILAVAATVPFFTAAQSSSPKVEARFTPDSVMIGDHFDLEVTIEKDVMQLVAFPEFHDGKLGGVIEILHEGAVDTVMVDGRRQVLRKVYRLTSFDEGLYGLGRYPMLYIDKNITDTIWSADSLRLLVNTFDIDPENEFIYDIKRPIDTPLKPGEISGYIAWGMLALAAIIALIWYLIRRKKNLDLFGRPKYVDPPHVAAIKSLEILHNQKLWQNNKHKQYYTGITDILRLYIDGRYSIPALEMTSQEIISGLQNAQVPEKNFAELKTILSEADLVKFAKYIPDADTNESVYTYAYYFVENTKPQEVETDSKQEEF